MASLKSLACLDYEIAVAVYHLTTKIANIEKFDTAFYASERAHDLTEVTRHIASSQCFYASANRRYAYEMKKCIAFYDQHYQYVVTVDDPPIKAALEELLALNVEFHEFMLAEKRAASPIVDDSSIDTLTPTPIVDDSSIDKLTPSDFVDDSSIDTLTPSHSIDDSSIDFLTAVTDFSLTSFWTTLQDISLLCRADWLFILESSVVAAVFSSGDISAAPPFNPSLIAAIFPRTSFKFRSRWKDLDTFCFTCSAF